MSENFVSLKVAAEKHLFDDAVSKATHFSVRPDVIVVRPGFNRPIVRANIDQFKVAIRNGGTIPEISVAIEDNRIELVDGEHRWRAVMELRDEGMDIPTMAAMQFRGDLADRYAHMLASGQGEPVTPLVQGEKFMELLRLQWTAQKIADRIGVSKTHVENCIRLAEAPLDVKAHISSGAISSTAAAKAIKEHGSNAGAVITEALAAGAVDGKTQVKPKDVAPKEKQKPKEVQKLLALLDRCRPYVMKVADDPASKTVAISTAMGLIDEMDGAK